MRGEKRRQTAADPHRKGTGPDNCPATAKKKKMSTAVQRGRGDARRGVRPQTGGAEAERIATAGVRSAAELGQCANLKLVRHGNRYASMVVKKPQKPLDWSKRSTFCCHDHVETHPF